MADLDKAKAESAVLQTKLHEHEKVNQACKEALEEARSSAAQQQEEAAAAIAQLTRTSRSQLEDATEKHSRALQDSDAKLLAATEAAAAQRAEAAATIAELHSERDLLSKDLAAANAKIEALQQRLEVNRDPESLNAEFISLPLPKRY